MIYDLRLIWPHSLLNPVDVAGNSRVDRRRLPNATTLQRGRCQPQNVVRTSLGFRNDLHRTTGISLAGVFTTTFASDAQLTVLNSARELGLLSKLLDTLFTVQKVQHDLLEDVRRISSRIVESKAGSDHRSNVDIGARPKTSRPNQLGELDILVNLDQRDIIVRSFEPVLRMFVKLFDSKVNLVVVLVLQAVLAKPYDFRISLGEAMRCRQNKPFADQRASAVKLVAFWSVCVRITQKGLMGELPRFGRLTTNDEVDSFGAVEPLNLDWSWIKRQWDDHGCLNSIFTKLGTFFLRYPLPLN